MSPPCVSTAMSQAPVADAASIRTGKPWKKENAETRLSSGRASEYRRTVSGTSLQSKANGSSPHAATPTPRVAARATARGHRERRIWNVMKKPRMGPRASWKFIRDRSRVNPGNPSIYLTLPHFPGRFPTIPERSPRVGPIGSPSRFV